MGDRVLLTTFLELLEFMDLVVELIPKVQQDLVGQMLGMELLVLMLTQADRVMP
jgi:hypothetical protein